MPSAPTRCRSTLVTRSNQALYEEALATRVANLSHFQPLYAGRAGPRRFNQRRGAGGRFQSDQPEKEDFARYFLPSTWLAVARDAASLCSLVTDQRWSTLPRTINPRVWTDDLCEPGGRSDLDSS
jgi:hypothetical protein